MIAADFECIFGPNGPEVRTIIFFFMNLTKTGHHLEDPAERPSKTQRKQESHALQDLGAQLADLSGDALRELDPPEDLAAAIEELRRVRSHEGRRRQLQLIGKRMRALDTDVVERLRRGLERVHRPSREDTLRLHELEDWRERLLTDEHAMADWIAAHPDTDAQHLRTLLRAARKERAQTLPPRAFREIFQLLKVASDSKDTP